MTRERWEGLAVREYQRNYLDEVAERVFSEITGDMLSIRSRYRPAVPLDTIGGPHLPRVMDVADLVLSAKDVLGGGWLTEEEINGVVGLKLGEKRHPNIDSFYGGGGYWQACLDDLQLGLRDDRKNPTKMVALEAVIDGEMEQVVAMGKEQVGLVRERLIAPMARLKAALEAKGFDENEGLARIQAAPMRMEKLNLALSDYWLEPEIRRVRGFEPESVGLVTVGYGIGILTRVTTESEEAQADLRRDSAKLKAPLQRIASVFERGLESARSVIQV